MTKMTIDKTDAIHVYLPANASMGCTIEIKANQPVIVHSSPPLPKELKINVNDYPALANPTDN